MQSIPIGGPEVFIIILLILGLWWLLTFFPRKLVATACALLVSTSLTPQQTTAPIKQPVAEQTEFLLT